MARQGAHNTKLSCERAATSRQGFGKGTPDGSEGRLQARNPETRARQMRTGRSHLRASRRRGGSRRDARGRRRRALCARRLASDTPVGQRPRRGVPRAARSAHAQRSIRGSWLPPTRQLREIGLSVRRRSLRTLGRGGSIAHACPWARHPNRIRRLFRPGSQAACSPASGCGPWQPYRPSRIRRKRAENGVDWVPGARTYSRHFHEVNRPVL
jgi:hypothetical protein